MKEFDKYYRHGRAEIMPFLPASYGRVLEVGCGAGHFGAQLHAAEIWGVEPDAVAAQLAAARFHRVLQGFYEAVAAELPDGYFDLIVCNDVIEHVPDHDGFLLSLTRKLAPGGHLVGSVPNMRYYKNLGALLFRRQWQYVDAGILDRTHLRFFTDRSLRDALARAGLRIERFEGVNSALQKGLLKNLGKSLLLGGLWLISGGAMADLKYLQFAFRAAKI